MGASRLAGLGTYGSYDLERRELELRTRGVDVINLGIGEPSLALPAHVVDALVRSAADTEMHRYPAYEGLRELREAIAVWYRNRFAVDLDPETEILPLNGAKSGLAHLPLAVLNPGRMCLIPDPGYPAFRSGAILAHGIPVPMTLHSYAQFLPDLQSIPRKVMAKADLMFLNYPHNPTGSTATLKVFQDVVQFAQDNGVLVAHDNSLSEFVYEGLPAPSFLQASGAKEVGLEFHSLSKSFGMAGLRIGFAVGNQTAIRSLKRLQVNMDRGVPQMIQRAAIAALAGAQDQPGASGGLAEAQRHGG